MSTNVFLAPCDPENFDRTVQSAVDLSEYPEHPSALSGKEFVRFWGVRDGVDNESYFEKMQPGDLVLFYHDGAYVGTGWVGATFEDELGWASTTFWNDAPAKLVYTLTEFAPVRLSKTAVNTIFDYVPNFNPQGLMRVADTRVTKSPKAIKMAVERYSERTP